MYAEGHGSAFGIGILDELFDSFMEYTDNALQFTDFSSCYKVDFIYQHCDFKPSDIIEIAGLKSLWGQGFEEVYVAIENIKIYRDNIILMSKDKNPTLKITLPNGTSLIKFKSSIEEFQSLIPNEFGFIEINAVGKCESNTWGGSTTA